MAYFELIELIDDKIKQNGLNAITGQVLNGILNSMVDALGAGMKFMGIVSPTSSAPEEDFPKFCLAFKPGIYTNFNVATPATFMSGFAVIFDRDGSNKWAISTWQMPANSAAVPFVTDAVVKDNELPGNTILYVSDASRRQNSSSFRVKQTNIQGDDLGVVAAYSGGAVNDEIKSYDLSIANTNSTLSISVNWSAVPSGEDVDFDYSEPIPASAYGKQVPTTKSVEPVTLVALAADYDTQGYFYAIQTRKDFDAGNNVYLTRTDIKNLLKKTALVLDFEASHSYYIPKTVSCFYQCDFDTNSGIFYYRTIEYHHTPSSGPFTDVELFKDYERFRFN